MATCRYVGTRTSVPNTLTDNLNATRKQVEQARIAPAERIYTVAG